MNFEERARNAYERGDKIRALVLLVEGVKRHPEHTSGLDFLLSLYGDEMESAGMESDVVRALSRQTDPELWLADLAFRLEEREQEAMLRSLSLVATEWGFNLDPSRAPQLIPREEVLEEAPEEIIDESPSAPDPILDEEIPEEAPLIEEPVSEPVSEPVAPRMPAPVRTATRDEPRDGPILRIRYILLIIIVVGLGAFLGYQGWLTTNRASRIAQLDAALRSIDPFDPSFLGSHFDERQWPPGEDREPFDERYFFASTLIALELGEDLDEIDDAGFERTAWGRAGHFHRALARGDMEVAIAEAMRIDRTQPDGLVGSWVRARHCEARGELQCADEGYRRLTERFPDFVPALTHRMRLGARRHDREQWEQARAKLQRSHPEHPYAGLPFPDPFPALEGGTEPSGFSLMETGDEGGRALSNMMLGAEALGRGEWAVATPHLEQALAIEPELAPALILLGILEAAQARPQEARSAFEKAAACPLISARLVREIQSWAPLSLIASGRADLAMEFVILAMEPAEGLRRGVSEKVEEIIAEARQNRVPALGLGADGTDEAQDAILIRARTLNALGAADYVDAALSSVLEDDARKEAARLERVFALIHTGERRTLKGVIQRMGEGHLRTIAEVNLAFLEGDYEEAISLATKINPEQGPADLRMLRPLVLSYMATGRGREALALLDLETFHPTRNLEWESLRLRVDARLGRRDASTLARLATLSAVEPTTVTRQVDLATTAFWLRQMDETRKWAERALEFAPAHPEVNWLMGLIERMDADTNASRRHFKKAWRGDEDDPHRLVELGYVQLDFSRYALAQEVFFSAVRRDRHNIEALRGLGMAYLGFDVDRGRRDLARLVHNYGTQPHQAAQRGELFKWLAVLHGSREGEDEAKIYLKRAEGALGQRADVLVEHLWPETSQERGRSSLRTSLALIRRAVGAAALL
ncbi:MAG: hypothetical protein ACNA8W_14810, partial [Bradymonadaceae bacterium]